jgi:hypothetical protein
MPAPRAERRAPGSKRSVLTPDLIERLVRNLATGVFLKDAAVSAGVHPSSLFRWRAHADDPEPLPEHFAREGDYVAAHDHWLLCGELRERTEKAEADAKAASLGRIRKAGADGTWQADAWYLERKYPHEYGRRVAEVSGPDGGPIEVADARSRLASLIERVAAVDESDVDDAVTSNGNGAHP